MKSRVKEILKNLFILLLIIVSVISIEVDYYGKNKVIDNVHAEEVEDDEDSDEEEEEEEIDEDDESYYEDLESYRDSGDDSDDATEETEDEEEEDDEDDEDEVFDEDEIDDEDSDEEEEEEEEIEEEASDSLSTTNKKCIKPKIICPKQNGTITINGEKIIATRKVTKGIKNKIFPVDFNKSYSFLSYSVESGSEDYISIDADGVIVGKKKTAGATAYVIVTATMDGKEVAKKRCPVKVYSAKNTKAETQTIVNLTNDAMKINEENVANIKEYCLQSTATETGKAICKNITIKKGKTKAISKMYSTSIKKSKIKKAIISFNKDSNKKYVKKSGNKKIKANKVGETKYKITLKDKKKELASCEGTIKVVKKNAKTTTETTTKKKKSKKKAKEKVEIYLSFVKSTDLSKVSVIQTIIGKTEYLESIAVGETVQYKVRVIKGSDILENPKVTWSINKKSIAKVDNEGNITGKKPGTATITIKSNGKKKKVVITVTKTNASLVINPESKTITLKPKETADYTVYVDKDKNEKITYKSSNKKVATVDSKGKITAKKRGKATITIKSTNKYELKEKIKVTVKTPKTNNSIPLQSFTLKNMKLAVKNSKKMKKTLVPSNATNTKLIWTSSDEKIATVDSKGNIKGISQGTVTITATQKNSAISASAMVTVVSPVKVTGLTIKVDSEKVPKNGYTNLKAVITPTTATNKAVSWKSSDKKIATVNSKGVVTAKKKGTVTITAISKNNKKIHATKKIKIIDAINSNIVKKNKLSLKVNATKNIFSTDVIPIDYILSSSDTKIATIDTAGTVTALTSGSTRIKVVQASTNKEIAYIDVYVKNDTDTSNTISCSDLYFNLKNSKKSKKLKIKVNSKKTDYSRITMKSSDKKIATINKKGKVTPKKKGKATITVTLKSNKKVKSTCEVVVKDYINLSSKINFKKSDEDVKNGHVWNDDNEPKKTTKSTTSKKSSSSTSQNNTATTKQKNNYINIKNVSQINKTEFSTTLQEGSSFNLQVKLDGDNSYNSTNTNKFRISSISKNAIVTNENVVKATAQGKAIIKITYKNNSDISANLILNINPKVNSSSSSKKTEEEKKKENNEKITTGKCKDGYEIKTYPKLDGSIEIRCYIKGGPSCANKRWKLQNVESRPGYYTYICVSPIDSSNWKSAENKNCPSGTKFCDASAACGGQYTGTHCYYTVND